MGETNKELLSELESLSRSMALEAAELEVDEEIVHNPSLARERETKRDLLYARNHKEIFEILSREFWSLSKFEEYLAPFLQRSDLQTRETYFKDMEKVSDLSSYTALDDPQKTLQNYYQLSNETLDFLYRSAHEAVAEKRFEEAATFLKFVNLLNPSLPDVWLLYGYCLKEQSFPERALEAFAMATLLNPSLPEPRLYSAEVYLALKSPEDAKIELEELELILPDSPKRADLEPYLHALKSQLKQGGSL